MTGLAQILTYQFGTMAEIKCPGAAHTARGMADPKEVDVSNASEFWRRVEKTDACWLWIGSRRRDGYGRHRVNGTPRRIRAHRLSWEMHFGAIPSGMSVLHHCDNPPCVRPDHLFLGTDTDNTADKVRKGRANSALTIEQVREVRLRLSDGTSQAVLARQYGVSRSVIWDIAHGRRARWVT